MVVPGKPGLGESMEEHRDVGVVGVSGFGGVPAQPCGIDESVDDRCVAAVAHDATELAEASTALLAHITDIDTEWT